MPRASRTWRRRRPAAPRVHQPRPRTSNGVVKSGYDRQRRPRPAGDRVVARGERLQRVGGGGDRRPTSPRRIPRPSVRPASARSAPTSARRSSRTTPARLHKRDRELRRRRRFSKSRRSAYIIKGGAERASPFLFLSAHATSAPAGSPRLHADRAPDRRGDRRHPGVGHHGDLSQRRVQGGEASAIATLDAINQAQFAFAQLCGNQRFAPTLVASARRCRRPARRSSARTSPSIPWSRPDISSRWVERR